MTDVLTTIQIDIETRETLRKLAGDDFRSMAAELKWMVSQEYARRFVQAAAQVSAPKAEPVRK